VPRRRACGRPSGWDPLVLRLGVALERYWTTRSRTQEAFDLLVPTGPRVRPQCPLHLQRRRRARPRRGEHREEPGPGGIHLRAAVSGQRRPDQLVMAGQNLGIHVLARALQQRSGSLDIGEQEREHPHGHSVEARARQQQQPALSTPAWLTKLALDLTAIPLR